MTKNIVESWITTVLGIFIAIFGGVAFWFDKASVWGCIAIWIIGAVFIFANEKKIMSLLDKIPKFK